MMLKDPRRAREILRIEKLIFLNTENPILTYMAALNVIKSTYRLPYCETAIQRSL